MADDKDYEQSALGKRVNELMDDGYDFGEAVKQAMSEGLKDGGRVGMLSGGLLKVGIMKAVEQIKDMDEANLFSTLDPLGKARTIKDALIDRIAGFKDMIKVLKTQAMDHPEIEDIKFEMDEAKDGLKKINEYIENQPTNRTLQADGGAIGIEVLFSPKRKDLQGGGPAGGASAGGNYGGNRNPDQTYGGSIFSGGGGGKGGNNKPPVVIKKKQPVPFESDVNPMYQNWIKPAAAVKTDFLKKQGWYNNPFKLSGTPLFKAGAEAGGYGLDYDTLTEGGLTVGQVLEGMAGGKYDTFDQGVRDSLESQILGNVDFGDTFQKNWSTDVVEPTIKDGKIDIDETKLEVDEMPVKPKDVLSIGVKDGGRVGLENGGTSNWWDGLTGEAKGIYDSMTAYGASDAEIQSKLQTQGLWSPDGTPDTGTPGQVTGIINQNIVGDRGINANMVDTTDYSFNKKNYAPGGKLEINPEALGIGFYESGPGGKKDQGFIESFMGAAVPNKMKSTVTMPGYEQFQAVNPNEFRNFIDANIEGIPGDLTRQDLANMYEDYNKFLGRSSNYAGARVPGSAGNLFGMAMSGITGIPFVGQGISKLGEFFGSQGDKSMRSKYSVDNAGYGQGTNRDEFGTFTGGKTLLGKTKNYVERMENDINFLENDFFDGMFKDINNLTETEITAMKNKNSFNFKKLQAYKNRVATEKINQDFAKKQAEIEAAQAAQAAEAAKRRQTERRIISGGPNIQGDGGGNRFTTSSGDTYAAGDYSDVAGTLGDPREKMDYQDGGLASMFIRRR